MNVIHDLVNIGHCAQNGISGTSNDFCPLDISRIKKLLRFPYGYKFADDFEPTEDNFNLLIQSGVITPLYTIDGANFTTEADGIQTIDGGKNKLIEKFPYKIEAKLYNGIQGFQNTLTIANANAHSFLIVDVKGTIFGTKGKDGKFRPINSEFLHVGAYVGAGAEAAYYMIDFQLDRNQFDTGLSGLRTDDYDFEIDDIKGFTNLEISISTAPVTGDTGFSFKVLRKEDRVAQIGLSNTELSCIFKTNTCTNQFFCSICQEQKDTNPELFNIKTLICNHTFHNKCIKKWLSKNKTCPLCRLDLSSN